MFGTEDGSQLPGYQLSPAQINMYAQDAGPALSGAALPGPTAVALGFDSLSDPVFPPAAWLEETGLADHPLLRGLLLELPPKGSAPSPEWLNRWFEAARSILELLYVRG